MSYPFVLHLIPTAHAANDDAPSKAATMLHIARKRTHNVDGFIVDPTTGEVLGSYTTQAFARAPYDYELPQVDQPLAAQLSYELDPAPRPDAPEIEVETLPDGIIDLDAQRSKRGPKPKVRVNQYASVLRVAHHDRRGWIDDYVFGACTVVGGLSGGKLNVNPSHVLRACLLSEISTEIVKHVIRLKDLCMMSDQQARRVCQCARFALDGMELYLDRNPTMRQGLQFEVDFAYSYHEGEADIPLKSAGV